MYKYSYAQKNTRTAFLEMVQNFTMRIFFSFGIAATATVATVPMSVKANNDTYMYALNDAPHDPSAEIENLKRQLQAATRDLHEYKTQLFRSSHPQDLAKIASLNQQIADREAINEKMNETLRSLEKDMLQARKQAGTLEVTADALSAMILTQRTANENQQKEHSIYVRTLSDELQTAMAMLEKEQQLTSKMDKQLNETQQSLAAYEKRINELEIGHAEALAATAYIESKLKETNQQHSDAHQELHFALNDLEQAKNALTMEVFQAKSELEKRVASEGNLKQNLTEATQRLQEQEKRFAHLESELQNALFETSMLKFQMADVQSKQMKIDEQNTAHLNHLTMSLDYARDLEASQIALQENVQNKLSKHIHDNESLKRAVQEKEEVLTTAMLFYEATLKESQAREEALHASLMQSQSHSCQMQTELETARITHNEEQQRLEKLKTDKEHFQTMFEKRHFDAIALEEQFRNDHLALKNDLNEKEQAFSKAALNYLSMLDDYRQQVEAVEARLTQAEKEGKALQARLESSLNSHDQEKTHVQTLHDEKEQLRSSFEKYQAEAMELQEKWNFEQASLQNALDEKEAAFSAVAFHYLSMLEDFRHQVEVTEERLSQSEQERARLEEKLSNIASKEIEIKTLQESTELLKAKFLAEQEELQAKLEEQLLHSETMQSQLHDMLSKQAISAEHSIELEGQLQQLNSRLEEKDHQLLETLTQLQSLKLKAAELNDQLGAASMESSHAEERIAALQATLATTQAEQTSRQLSLTLAIDKLQAQANEDKAIIAQLSEDIEQLGLNNQYKADARRQEFDQQVHSFSALVERQDRALADAGETLHQAQVLSEQLLRENEHLKQRIAMQAETADRNLNGDMHDAWGGRQEKSEHEALAPLIIGPRSSGSGQSIFMLPGK